MNQQEKITFRSLALVFEPKISIPDEEKIIVLTAKMYEKRRNISLHSFRRDKLEM
jgi:hypothetical protein